MDIKKLRVGNWVSWRDMEFQVAGILQYDALDCEYNPKYPEWHPEDVLIIEFKPIPISEEWLLKFGFEKRGPVDALYNDHWRHPNLNPVFSEETFTALTIDDGIDIAYDIKYVHQIQNVFFVLTGQELTIKELV